MKLWQKILETIKEEWAKISEDNAELKPMELKKDPKSCGLEISPEIMKFQEGSGMFGHN